jgi:hypothetical protein
VDMPVSIQLLDGNRREVRARADATSPFLLWDAQAAAPPRALPNGVYYLTSSIGGNPVRFAQACPRPRRRRPPCAPGKGGMGMMMCPSRRGMP